MNAGGAVAIFVKTPGRSPLKTRLAAGCGAHYVQHWYPLAAAAVASVAQAAAAACGLQVYWAVAENDCGSHWQGLPVLQQGEGSLGERMARVHDDLVARHGFGLLIGADSPQLQAEALCRAARWLSHDDPRLALGPAEDGGFWQFGANRSVPVACWTRPAYSTASAAADLRDSLVGAGEWLQLECLLDVDHADDLEPLCLELDRLTQPTAEQQALLRWMRNQRVAA